MIRNILLEGTHMGFPFIVTHNGGGFRCGYILIPKSHPWYGVDYDNIQAEVHGGLTFADAEAGGTWRIGFDCAHLYDAQDPSLPFSRGLEVKNSSHTTIKDTDFVKAECENLCEQAFNAK